MAKKIKIGSFWLDVTSAVVGAVGVCALSAMPVVGDYVTKMFTTIRGFVSGIFNKK